MPFVRRSRPLFIPLLVVLLLAVGWVAVGCGGSEKSTSDVTTSPEATPPAQAKAKTKPSVKAPTPPPQPPGERIDGLVKQGQTLLTALSSSGVPGREAYRVYKALQAIDFPERRIRPGHEFTVWLEGEKVSGLDYVFEDDLIYQVRRQDDELIARIAEAEQVAVPVETETEQVDDLPAPTGKANNGVVQEGDNMTAAITGIEIAPEQAERIIEALRTVDFPFRSLQPGQRFVVWTDEQGKVTAFDYQLDRVTKYILRTVDGALVARRLKLATTTKVGSLGGRVNTSVYQAILDNGETDNLASLVSNLFAWDIDFYSDPRVGDSFRLIYEKHFLANGEFLGYGRLLAAEYDGEVTGRKFGYWYSTDNGEWDGFYDQNGTQLRKTFLVAPLDTMRMTSSFGMRNHPIDHKRKMHYGVDYGAPTGTPIWAVADGEVISAGSSGGAGNMVHLKHAGGYETVYLHLSRITVRRGQGVHQKQMIGKVGSSGKSTGPHLDFRVKYNGNYINPQRLRAISTPLKKLPQEQLARFRETIGFIKPQLEAIPISQSTT